MSLKRNLIVGIVLTAATAVGVVTTVSAPESTDPSSATDSNNDACGYQWAYHDAPELTALFNDSVQALNPDATGRVDYFGEDCVYPDGTSTFGVMETDFHVQLQVDDLNQEDEFGNWMAQVMEIVTNIPREELAGRYGFVEFSFVKSDTEQVTFRVPIQQYMDEADGKSGSELFKMFASSP